MKNWNQFLNEDINNEQEITVILKEDDYDIDFNKNAESYGAKYIKNSYQKSNHMISISFNINKDLLSDFINYLEDIGVEDIITE
jgi:hypothetical protein